MLKGSNHRLISPASLGMDLVAEDIRERNAEFSHDIFHFSQGDRLFSGFVAEQGGFADSDFDGEFGVSLSGASFAQKASPSGIKFFHVIKDAAAFTSICGITSLYGMNESSA